MVIVKQIIKYFAGIVPVFAALGIQVVVIGIISVIYSIFISIKIGVEMRLEGDLDNSEIASVVNAQMEQPSEARYLISVMAILACGIVFIFWYRKLRRGAARVVLGSVFKKNNIMLLIVLGIGSQFFISGVIRLIQPIFDKIFSEYAETMEGLMSGSPYVVLLLTIIIAPITEELIFRGVMFLKLRREVPLFAANIIQAVIFGIYHMNIVQGIYAFVLGLVLGYVAIKFKTIMAPIVLHMIVNASAFLLVFFGTSTFFSVILVVIGGALLVFGLSRVKEAEGLTLQY